MYYQGTLSQEKHFELGTPQGDVLSPTLFNVLVNRCAKESLGSGVNVTIYADDILIQSKSVDGIQCALNKFNVLIKQLGLVINENKTKFHCRSISNQYLHINGKSLERVGTYKYLGVHVGYTAESREAEVCHLSTQCRARLQPLKTLAWSGSGVGVPLLRMLYISTIRSIVEYASPVLFCFDDGRFNTLEKMQNQAMRVVLNCPKNAMVDCMRLELNLPTVKERIEEVNTIAAIKHIRSNGGEELSNCISDYCNKIRAFRHQGKRGYIKLLCDKLISCDLLGECVRHNTILTVPPWADQQVHVDIHNLERKKVLYGGGKLKTLYDRKINSLGTRWAQIFCDGSVLESGRAGCGFLIREFINDQWVESEHSYRLTDNVSSTQAELQAILCSLRMIHRGEGNVHLFSDSQGALESLNSRQPVYKTLVLQCKEIINDLYNEGRLVKFMWIPSHVGIFYNERVDAIAKAATQKSSIDEVCYLTLRQLKTKMRKTMNVKEQALLQVKYNTSFTMQHYIRVAQETNFTYGRYLTKWKDSVCTRLRLGYKYYWQLNPNSGDQEGRCRLCNDPGSHILNHYVLNCSFLSRYRNANITNVTDQIIWMFSYGMIDPMLRECESIHDIIRG